ncbi:BaiN/RdsA family NAD(P)/FAD-dependent oxidoreductase [Desulfotruncus alcoholivorax]|uniref:NAD(P)/FAD-dependent oxidoreductase n=1 Tax=Desulfotruncus alcoholivorax TaxID=265477 RepID=UPI0004282983|nr:NAD(P)/FAD-dependent oxidoreductase [Desulfotruncus alcoholivorax]
MKADKTKPVRVAVVGGGAAGLTAAIAARRRGAAVTVLERMNRVGKKILATGNGRCNMSNIDLGINHYHGRNPKFAFGALGRFDFSRTMEFFEELGIAWKVEEGGKVFPVSNQASSVLDVIRYEIERIGVEVICEAEVKGISKSGGEFILDLGNGSRFRADRVILTTGGKAAPNLGSNGSGYILARKMGHQVLEPFPALVQLRLASNFLKQISGIKFDFQAEVLAGEKPVARAGGEILFTGYGISGPPILALSRTVGENLQKGEQVQLKLIIIDYMTRDELEAFLIRRLEQQAHKDLPFSFVGFINKRLVPVLLKEAGLRDINKKAGQVTAGERNAILNILQDWRFEVTGTNSWVQAQVTAGGVDVKDIDNKTMESRLVKGLYFAGEILDIDGDCGGYNLQWAWSSGFVAGESAAT